MAGAALPPGRVAAERRGHRDGMCTQQGGSSSTASSTFWTSSNQEFRIQVSREEKGYRLDGALGLPLLPLSSL